MCLPPRGDEQWSDAFQRASDAIWMSANREQAWDDLLNEKGAHNVVQGAISLRKQIVGKAFEISRDKSYQVRLYSSTYIHGDYVHVDRYDEVFLQVHSCTQSSTRTGLSHSHRAEMNDLLAMPTSNAGCFRHPR